MTDSKLLDSSVWLQYLFEGGFKELIEQEKHFLLSSISLFEIKAKLLKRKISGKDIQNKMKFIREKSNIINVDIKIADKAAELSVEKNLPAIDSIVYASSLINNVNLITLDNDFRGLENVEILNR